MIFEGDLLDNGERCKLRARGSPMARSRRYLYKAAIPVVFAFLVLENISCEIRPRIRGGGRDGGRSCVFYTVLLCPEMQASFFGGLENNTEPCLTVHNRVVLFNTWMFG